MFNLVACYASLAQNSALTNVTPVTDPLVTVQNARFIFPMMTDIGCLQALIPDGTRCRVNTPSLRNIALPEVYPIRLASTQGTNPVIVGPMWGTMRIPQNDEFGIDISRGGSAAGDVFCGIWYGAGRVNPPSGPVITLRATATIVLTVGTWVTQNLTFDQSLPYGRYAVVGMQATITNGIFARLAFPGQTQYRPGVPAVEAVGSYINPQVFRMGNFSLFGTFDSTAQPLVEVLGNTAGSQAGVFLLDLIKVA